MCTSLRRGHKSPLKRLPHIATAEQAAELTPARFAAARRAEAQAVA